MKIIHRSHVFVRSTVFDKPNNSSKKSFIVHIIYMQSTIGSNTETETKWLASVPGGSITMYKQ
jgi:hypothetical protein